jgi:hypothetical protein
MHVYNHTLCSLLHQLSRDDTKKQKWIKYQHYIRVRTTCVVAKNRDRLQRGESLRFSSTNLPADIRQANTFLLALHQNRSRVDL